MFYDSTGKLIRRRPPIAASASRTCWRHADLQTAIGRWWGLENGFIIDEGCWIRRPDDYHRWHGWLNLYRAFRQQIWDHINAQEVQ